MVSRLVGRLRGRDLYPLLAIGLFGNFDLDRACGGRIGGTVVLRGLHFRNFRESTKLYRVQVNIQSTWLGIEAFRNAGESQLFPQVRILVLLR